MTPVGYYQPKKKKNTQIIILFFFLRFCIHLKLQVLICWRFLLLGSMNQYESWGFLLGFHCTHLAAGKWMNGRNKIGFKVKPYFQTLQSLTLLFPTDKNQKPHFQTLHLSHLGVVWYDILSNIFQFFNNITRIFTHIFTHTYFQKIQTMLSNRPLEYLF